MMLSLVWGNIDVIDVRMKQVLGKACKLICHINLNKQKLYHLFELQKWYLEKITEENMLVNFTCIAILRYLYVNFLKV